MTLINREEILTYLESLHKEESRKQSHLCCKINNPHNWHSCFEEIAEIKEDFKAINLLQDTLTDIIAHILKMKPTEFE